MKNTRIKNRALIGKSLNEFGTLDEIDNAILEFIAERSRNGLKTTHARLASYFMIPPKELTRRMTRLKKFLE